MNVIDVLAEFPNGFWSVPSAKSPPSHFLVSDFGTQVYFDDEVNFCKAVALYPYKISYGNEKDAKAQEANHNKFYLHALHQGWLDRKVGESAQVYADRILGLFPDFESNFGTNFKDYTEQYDNFLAYCASC